MQKEVELVFDRGKMASLGIGEEMVKGIIQGSAIKVPLGLFELDQAEKAIVVDGNMATIENLNQLTIPLPPGSAGMAQGMASVQLKDIAKLEVLEKAESVSRTNGKASIGINVTKSGAANTVDVVNAVKEQAKQFEQSHPGVEIVTMLDQGEPIEQSVSTMVDKALYGALFAMMIILLFLRNVRTTIISIVSIPLSLLITLFILKEMDISLNMMSLGAMTVAIGRVVDDSIVVIENNYRRLRLHTESLKGKALVIDATREMFLPIMSSTLVCIAVFVPLGTVSGPIGQLFTPFALTMVFALLASLLVAVTVVPILTHMMFRKGMKSRSRRREKTGSLAAGYRRLLQWTLNHKLWTAGFAVAVLVGSLLLASVVGVSFLPEEEQKYAMVTYSPGAGELLSDVEQTALQAETMILQRKGVTNLQYSVGAETPFSPGPSKAGLFYVQYDKDTADFESEKKKLIADLEGLGAPGAWGTMDFSGGLGGSKLSLFVYGSDMDEIQPAVEQIQALLQADDSFDKVKSSISETYDQYTLVADQRKLSQWGLTAGQIAMRLSPVRERSAVAEVRVEDRSYPVYVHTDQQPYRSLDEIGRSTLMSPYGAEVAVKDVVRVEEGKTAGSVTRKNGQLYAEVSADVVVKDVGKASSNIQEQIDQLKLPPSVKVDFGGVTEQINETFTQLGLAMAAAIGIVYFLLVLTFGGALTPFVILFSLPFIAIGAIAGLYVSGETISAPAMMGALMLIGIVVTNAIVLIDRVINKEKEGLPTREALLEAAGTRLRPILMTALATIFALLPLALGFEGTEGSLISKGLGVTVIGGLLSSTLLTLIIVPLVYEWFAKFRRAPLQEQLNGQE